MSLRSIILASALTLAASAAFAGNTSALDVRKIDAGRAMSSQATAPMTMTAQPSAGEALRSGKVQDILGKCRFVNTARDTYCDQFKQSNR